MTFLWQFKALPLHNYYYQAIPDRLRTQKKGVVGEERRQSFLLLEIKFCLEAN
jgi:hypothetical protein